MRGEEVSVVTTGTAGHTDHLPLHLTLHITNNLEQVLIYPPIELVGAGLIAASGLSDTVPAGVDLLTAEEQGTDLTEGETLAGKVSECVESHSRAGDTPGDWSHLQHSLSESPRAPHRPCSHWSIEQGSSGLLRLATRQGEGTKISWR